MESLMKPLMVIGRECQRLRLLPRLKMMRQYRSFSSLQPEDIQFFTDQLGQNSVKQQDLESYNRDWLGLHVGESKLVLLPSTTDQVSKVMSHCYARGLQIVVQGGNTSVVAGSVPEKDEIIVSMAKMNKITYFDDVSGVLACQSGCILESLEHFVNEKGFMMPYDLAAKGSCQIGGNIASNAGGIRYIKYGSLHGSILGLEAVLSDGTKLDMMSSLRKDNTGYDVKQLFIGSEGTLGIVTSASILCPVKPKDKLVVFLGLDSFEQIVTVLKRVRAQMNPYLSAFEMMDDATMDAVEGNLNLQSPFKSPFYALFEISIYEGTSEASVRDKLLDLLSDLMESQVIKEGTMSQDLSSYQQLWALRERIIEALKADGGCCLSYDVSLQYKDFYRVVEVMRDWLKGTGVHRISCCGHLGDNNLHLNITSKQRDDDLKERLEAFLHDWVGRHGGSISAEHGLGMKKRNLIYYSKKREVVDKMKQIKALFDPKGILNPKKVLPDD